MLRCDGTPNQVVRLQSDDCEEPKVWQNGSRIGQCNLRPCHRVTEQIKNLDVKASAAPEMPIQGTKYLVERHSVGYRIIEEVVVDVVKDGHGGGESDEIWSKETYATVGTLFYQLVNQLREAEQSIHLRAMPSMTELLS
jgi:hypothetical protein